MKIRTPQQNTQPPFYVRHCDTQPTHRARRALRIILLCCSVMLAAGCATTSATGGSSAALELRIDPADRVWLGDESYTIHDLPAALRRYRVPLKQPLRIHTPDSDNRALFTRLSSALRSAGYSRFVFVSAPHAEAHVVDPHRPKSGRPTTPRRVR